MLRNAARALLLCVLTAPALTQDFVGQPLWGFDDSVVPNRFNLLTVRVRNNTGKPIRKTLRLVKWAGGIERGAPMVRPCFLGPGAERFLQFLPFVVSTGDTWRLSWVEGGAAGLTVPQPTAAMPSTVLLEDDPVTAARRLRLKTFPPLLMPADAAAMGTLRAIVMDQEPDLSLLQRQALLDWLRRGGEVHVLKRGVAHPVFKDELDVLNLEEPVAAYGSGRIFRHEFDRFALRKKVRKEIHGGAEIKSLRHFGITPVSRLLRERYAVQDPHLEFGWGVIFLLSFVYLALIGPFLYRMSTTRMSWPLSLATLTAIIAVATWVFTIIGARGNNEIAKTRSWSYARLAGAEDWEVTRFANVFITTGGDYVFGTGKDYSAFSSAQTTERINGTIRNGSSGTYTVDMPRFSKRLVVHKSRVPGPRPGFAFDGETLTLDLDVDQVVSVHGKRLTHWISGGSNKWVRNRMRSSLLSRVVQFRDVNENTLVDTVIERMNLQNYDLSKAVTHEDHHVFFAVGPAPEAFRLPGKGPGVDLGDESGETVYRFDTLLAN